MNKKLIGLALLLTLAASLGACNQGGENTPADGGGTPGASPAESPAPATSP